jgi:hypothetical protein
MAETLQVWVVERKYPNKPWHIETILWEEDMVPHFSEGYGPWSVHLPTRARPATLTFTDKEPTT